jgi:hypothetical protein
MALAERGQIYDAGYIECLTAVAISAFWDYDAEEPLPFFSSKYGAPDRGVSTALRNLGCTWEERRSSLEDDPDGQKALAQLRVLLDSGPVVVGPVDMSRLVYIPDCETLTAVDHYIVVDQLTDQHVSLHDPAGFPFMNMETPQFLAAWRAETIHYRLGSYSMWGCIRIEQRPHPDAIFAATDQQIRANLRIEQDDQRQGVAGPIVFHQLADKVLSEGIPEAIRQHLSYFSFQLGARRCADYARFYSPYDQPRADIKIAQARAFGLAHAATMQQNWGNLSALLHELGGLERAFQTHTLSLSI